MSSQACLISWMAIGGFCISTSIYWLPEPVALAKGQVRSLKDTRTLEQTAEPAEQAIQYFSAGQTYYQNEQYTAALEAYQQALAVWESLDDQAQTAQALYEIGRTLRKLENYTTALSTFQQAQVIFEITNNRQGQGNAINGIGQTYQNLGQSSQALESFQQALEIFQQTDDRISQGYTLNNLGLIYQEIGQYAQALTFYRQAADALRRDEARSSIVVLTNMGVLYTYLGQYERALSSHQQALASSQQKGYRSEESDALHNIGFVYRNQGRYTDALDAYQQALAIRQASNSRAKVAETLNNIGLIYSLLGKDEQAVTVLKTALLTYRDLGDLAGEGLTLETLATAYRNKGDTHQALKTYLQALALLQQVGDQRAEIIARSHLGELFASQGKVELAILFYKQAVNLTEAIRQGVRPLPEAEQRTYTETVVDTYRQLANLLLQQERVLEAQRVLDLLKIQEIDGSIEEVRGDTTAESGIGLLSQENDIWETGQEQLAVTISIVGELQELRQISPQNRSASQNQRILELESLQGQLIEDFISFIDSQEIHQLIDQLSQTAQRQDILTELDQFPNLQDNMANIGHTALLYPLILDERLELVLVTSEGPPIHYAVSVSRTELIQTVFEFQTALRDRTSDPKPLAQKLYRWLIEPLNDVLTATDIDTLLYAPDGPLRYIPLAALHDGREWLTQRYQINHITAASLTDLNLRPSPAPSVLAGAFSRGNFQVTVLDRTLDFKGLPYAGIEVNQLSDIFPTQTFFDADFSRSSTEPLFNDYSIIHLATHAALLIDSPLDSFVLFGNGDRLTLADLRNWRGRLRSVDLIVLSACETGTGSIRDANGEEILGFGYLMQDAGARAVMASLWPVSDGGTQELMNNFYEALQVEGVTKAEALKQAQIALITGNQVDGGSGQRFALVPRNPDMPESLPNSHLSHPYYWAPFILIGNGL